MDRRGIIIDISKKKNVLEMNVMCNMHFDGERQAGMAAQFVHVWVLSHSVTSNSL